MVDPFLMFSSELASLGRGQSGVQLQAAAWLSQRTCELNRSCLTRVLAGNWLRCDLHHSSWSSDEQNLDGSRINIRLQFAELLEGILASELSKLSLAYKMVTNTYKEFTGFLPPRLFDWG
jgi:hypothetical protein